MGPIMHMTITDNDGSRAKETTSESMGPPSSHAEKTISAAGAWQEIAELVKGRVGEIALALLEAAKGGQLAHAKYLFEVAGIYPKGDENEASRDKESLTYRVLKEFGPPTEPVPCSEAQGTNSESKSAKGATEGACSKDGHLAN